MRANALITCVKGQLYEEISKITLKPLTMYAEKIDADIVVINDISVDYLIDKGFIFDHSIDFEILKNQQLLNQFMKFKINDLLEKYKRVVYLDISCLPSPNAKNVFKLVPEDVLGVYLENRGVNVKTSMCKYYNFKKIDSRYFNSGVMVMSNKHKDLFTLNRRKWHVFEGDYSIEQAIININRDAAQIKIKPMSYLYNFTGSRIRLGGYNIPPHPRVNFAHLTGGFGELSQRIDYLKKLANYWY